MPNLLELNDLYKETLTREIIEKTKSCALRWISINSTQYKTTEIQAASGSTPAVQWDFIITKTQIGNLSYTYTLDIKRNNSTYITTKNGPSFYSGRDTMVKELYEIVEIIVLQIDLKMKEVMQFVQKIEDCRS